MVSSLLIVQAALLTLAGGIRILHNPSYYHAPITGGWQQLVSRSTYGDLPCPEAGFYVHPQNCSQFYRCVDYAGTGSLFSRYLFECPKNHIFLTAAQTCLPGACNGLVQPVVQPPKPTPTPSPTPSDVPVPPSPIPAAPLTPSPVPATEAPTEFPDLSPVEPETESPFPATVTDTPSPPAPQVTTEEPTTASPPAEPQTCPQRYVQNPEYCNVYNPCNEPFVRYVCPSGTVFDQPRQMCRISALDDGLCAGKEIFKHTFLLRSDNIGSHVLLPDFIVLPSTRTSKYPYGLSHPTKRPGQTLNRHTASSAHTFLRPAASPSQTFARPTASPSQTFARPTASPAQNFLRPVASPSQTFARPVASPLQLYLWPTPRPVQGSEEPAAVPAYRPIFTNVKPIPDRPAQVYSRPDTFSPSFHSVFKNEARTKPLANVRRPDGHLHFPRFSLLDLQTYDKVV